MPAVSHRRITHVSDPLLNVEWGRHINEMMCGAIEFARTGRRYDMTTTPAGLR